MIVGIIQSNFIPWQGYFDLIDDVDLFIIHDDLQYTKGDWRNRNKIKTANGPKWITIPVKYKTHNQLICDTAIDYSSNQIVKIINQVRANYQKAPCFHPFFDEFSFILNQKFETISQLNIHLIQWVMKIMGIKTKLAFSSDFNPEGKKTQRVIDLLEKAGATQYLSGPLAKDYIETNQFEKKRIGLCYKVYTYGKYPQLYNDFEPNLSILDLLFNCGFDAVNYFKSQRPPERVV